MICFAFGSLMGAALLFPVAMAVKESNGKGGMASNLCIEVPLMANGLEMSRPASPRLASR
jgi:hypothetical protein